MIISQVKGLEKQHEGFRQKMVILICLSIHIVHKYEVIKLVE